MIAAPIPGAGAGAKAAPPGEREFQEALQHTAHNRRLEAAQAYVRALQFNPRLFQAAYNLGLLLQKMGRLEDAIGCYRHALQHNPDLGPAWGNLGMALRESGQGAEAVASFRQALRCRPGDPEVLNNLGGALLAELQHEGAIACYREALRRAPTNPGLHLNLGDALRAAGDVDEAICCLRRAIELRPDFADAHWSLAFALLLQGNYAEGFAEYEWRWRRPDFPAREFAAPLWRGESLSGRSLHVHTEQGAGDSIQFVRFLGALADRGARIVLECPRSLASLLKSAAGVHTVVPAGEPLPECDFHVPLLSLPHLLGATLSSLPAATSYLRPVAAARTPLPQASGAAPHPKVGVAWRGNPRHVNDRQRSIPLPLLEPLWAIPAVAFYSLQVAPAPEFAGEANALPGVVDLAGSLHDFADTAAVVAQLDLIISVDTSLAHLAGALGRPCWVLLPSAPDWRWLLQREDSPWYPTLRLFRQPHPGNWPAVLQKVCAALAGQSQSGALKSFDFLPINHPSIG